MKSSAKHTVSDEPTREATTETLETSKMNDFPIINQNEGLGVPFKLLGKTWTKVIAIGGTSTVYGMRQKSGESFALKILKPSLSVDQTLSTRFLSQAEKLRKIHCPSLLTPLEYGDSPYGPWWMMPWVDAIPLSQLISQGVHWSIGGITSVITQCCNALSALHRANLIHGDLKSENLLYQGDPRDPVNAQIWLIDPALEETNGIFGTPQFMSPEQFEHAELSPQSDLYSLGVILFQLTTGRLPYEGTLTEVANAIVHQSPPSPLSFQSPWPYPAEVEALIMNLLSKRPNTRQSAQEVIRILQIASGRRVRQLKEGWIEATISQPINYNDLLAQERALVSQAISASSLSQDTVDPRHLHHSEQDIHRSDQVPEIPQQHTPRVMRSVRVVQQKSAFKLFCLGAVAMFSLLYLLRYLGLID